MTFSDICEKMYIAFKRDNHPGIAGIAETEDCWIFAPANEKQGVCEYGLHPYIVDKRSIKVRIFDVLDINDWNMLKTAKKIDVPEHLRPIYQKK